MLVNRLAAILIAVMAVVCAQAANAADITTRKLHIKDNVDDVTKRKVQILSKDEAILYSAADSPGTGGASIYMYSDTDNFCLRIPAGAAWKDSGKAWKYKDPDTRNQLRISNRSLKINLRSDIGYSLSDDTSQGAVNVQVQFGAAGERYCMRCSSPFVYVDVLGEFLGKSCAAHACDGEVTTCEPTPMPTTTTTMEPLPGTILQAVLRKSSGKFRYALMDGVPGADSLCNTTAPGTHACTYSDLLDAEAAGDLDYIYDTNGLKVTSFWAIDALRDDSFQCVSDPGGVVWLYDPEGSTATGDWVPLTNVTGTLGTLQSGNCDDTKSVGCCL